MNFDFSSPRSCAATLGDLRVEQPAAKEFRALPDSGTSPYDRSGWPEGQEPVYVARLDLPQPGDWEVTVSARHALHIEQNPVQFLIPVTGMPAGAGASAAGTAAGAAAPPARTSAAALAITAVVVTVAAAAWVALRFRRRPA